MTTKKDPRDRRYVLSLRERRHEMALVMVCLGVCLTLFVKLLFF